MRFIFYCSFCVLCCKMVNAQTSRVISPVEAEANRLVARTRGYNAQQPIEKGPRSRILAVPCNDNCFLATVPLPVTLIKFEGKRVDEANVVLFWETSDETKNDYFEVERTLNPAVGYTVVGKLKGAGSTSSKTDYRLADANSFTEYTYYRLKQVDFDGSYTYSSIVGIKPAIVPLSIVAFPNPGQNKSLAFKVEGMKASEQAAISIYDVRGVRIYADNSIYINPEEKLLRPPVSHISPGKYTIKIKTNGRQAVSSFVVSP